jgi:DNA-binding NarL/FixJ family response regulator
MKILLCDDHALFRAGLALVLGELAPDVELLEAPQCQTALELAGAHPDLDLVLLDLDLPGMDGLAGLRRFRSEHPALPVVVVSASERSSDMRAAIAGGASGFVPKQSSRAELLAALRLVLGGGRYVPPSALAPDAEDQAAARRERRRERAAALTERQLTVLSLMARGLTNKEICGVLGIAEGTVKTHVAAIFEAMDVTNRTEAAVLARELGLRLPGEE